MILKKLNIFEKINNSRLKNMSRRCNFKKDSYKYKKADSNLETQIAIDEINSENLKLKAVNNSMQNKIDNAKMKCQLSRIDRAIDYNNTVASNEKKEIKNTLKKGKKFKRYSLVACLVSALTTCVGLYNQQDTVYIETFGFQVIAVLVIGFFVNVIMNELNNFRDKFFEKGSKSDLAFMMFAVIAISSYTYYSINTNFDFWKKYFTGAGLTLFSFMFDAVSIIYSILGYINSSLRYNKKYRNEINKVLETETPEEQKEESKDDKIIELKKKKNA